MYMYIQVSIYMYNSLLWHLRGARNNDIPVAKSIPSILCFPATCLPLTVVVNNYQTL